MTAKSIQILTPDFGPGVHWDFSAVASITRNLAECYLFFYLLCADDVPQVEKDARIILLNLHDNASRRRLFEETSGSDDDTETAAAKVAVHNDLVHKFNANPYLSALSEKRQKELIKGEKTPFIQDDMIERSKMDKTHFRFWYRFFSHHTHTGPVAFYRMAEHGRGSGVENYLDLFYSTVALRFAGDLIRRAAADFLVFFPDAEARGTPIKTSARTAGLSSKKHGASSR